MTFFCGRAGALALDAVSAAFGGGRPQVREIRSDEFESAVAVRPFGASSRDLAGILLVIATDAIMLRCLNAVLGSEPSMEVVNCVA